ncbi:MAG TPA: glycine dehydrogenase [Thermaerobacter sp.]
MTSRRRLDLELELERLEAADPSLSGITRRLGPLLDLLEAVDRGATLDVWVEFGGGHVVVADVASSFRGLVRDAAGPGLGLEGAAGELVVLLHHVERVRPEHATGGVRVLLSTGESLWFRAVRPGHSGLSRPPRP